MASKSKGQSATNVPDNNPSIQSDVPLGGGSPYAHLPRNLVFQAIDFAAAKAAYVGDVTPREFLVSQWTGWNVLLPPGDDGQFLFQPEDTVQVQAFDTLFAFMAFTLPNLAAAEAVYHDSETQRKKHKAITGVKLVYIQGFFGPAAEPMQAWAEREIGQQEYLLPARYGGIDAMHAWRKGAKGLNETVYVMESGCWGGHEDFDLGGGQRSVTTPYPNPPVNPLLHWSQHGTATVGIIAATENTLNVRKGMVGIAPAARVKVALVRPGLWKGGSQLDDLLADVGGTTSSKPGAVILLSMCYMPSPSNLWLPIEADHYMHGVITALLQPISEGGCAAVVIQPAGNSDTNVDGYLASPTGAIIVGASRSKPPFAKTLLSNFSSLGNNVHLFSWGGNVFTTSTDLKPGSSDPPVAADYYGTYTRMTGTSAAAAIVTGAAAVVQAKKRAAGPAGGAAGAHNCSDMLNQLIQSTSTSHPEAKIGIQPDLKKII